MGYPYHMNQILVLGRVYTEKALQFAPLTITHQILGNKPINRPKLTGMGLENIRSHAHAW